MKAREALALIPVLKILLVCGDSDPTRVDITTEQMEKRIVLPARFLADARG